LRVYAAVPPDCTKSAGEQTGSSCGLEYSAGVVNRCLSRKGSSIKDIRSKGEGGWLRCGQGGEEEEEVY